jgi:transcription-repair coupling factor (superfamily II helicase)
VNTLLLVVRIKAMCKRAHVARLDAGPKGATVQFHMDKFPNPAGLVEFVQEQRGLAKVKDNKIVVRRDWTSEADKIKGAFAIARDLAQHAAAQKTKAGLAG